MKRFTLTLALSAVLPLAVRAQVNTPAEVRSLTAPSKIAQLIGDYDRQIKKATENLTFQRCGLFGTDLGIPFFHNGRTYLAFGDAGSTGGDPLAWSVDTNLEDGFSLNFLTNSAGQWKPMVIPGIKQGAYEVPTEGLSLNEMMYLWYTTDSTPERMGRSVLARSNDDGINFQLIRDFSTNYFINVSVVNSDATNWPGSPALAGSSLYFFGSGDYRKSDVRLAVLPASNIENGSATRYFVGLMNGLPNWSASENEAASLFQNPVVGELSVTYDEQLARWIMLYNSSSPRGIVLRTAINPWGPWSDPVVLFDPGRDNGYCHFMHTSWLVNRCDDVSDPGRENEWGGEYGPYIFKHFSLLVTGGRRIYFTMSTWNPYTVMLMKSDLARLPNNVTGRPSLKLVRSADAKLTASWAVPSYGWFLEYNSTLSGGQPWQRLTYTPTSTSSVITAALADGRPGFYRLRRP